MESPVQRFATAVILPDEAAQQLYAIQQAYELPSWEPRLPFHITLVSPFMTHTSEDELATLLEPVTAERLPFPILLRGFDRFDNGESALFVAVVPDPRLTALADDSLAAVQHLCQPRSRPFAPHVTLAHLGSRAMVDRWMEQLASKTLSLEFTCDRFAILLLDETARQWNVVREFPLHP